MVEGEVVQEGHRLKVQVQEAVVVAAEVVVIQPMMGLGVVEEEVEGQRPQVAVAVQAEDEVGRFSVAVVAVV